MTYLFRGKSVETKEWLYGALIPEPYGICIQHMKDSTRHITRVDETTVGIWTGEEATNGKIFLGDKVEYEGEDSTGKPEYMSGVVVFEKGMFFVQGKEDDKDTWFDIITDNNLWDNNGAKWTITGNIHEGEVEE